MSTTDRGFFRELMSEAAAQLLAAVCAGILLAISMWIERLASTQGWPIAGWVFPVLVTIIAVALLAFMTVHVVRHLRRHGQTWNLVDISGVGLVALLLLVCLAGFACMGYDRLVVPARPVSDLVIGQVASVDVPMRTTGQVRAGAANLAGAVVDTTMPHHVWVADAAYDVHVDASGSRRSGGIIDEPLGSAAAADVRRPVAVLARVGEQTVLLTWPAGPTAPVARPGDRVEIGHRRGVLLDLWHVERIVGSDGSVRWTRPSRS